MTDHTARSRTTADPSATDELRSALEALAVPGDPGREALRHGGLDDAEIDRLLPELVAWVEDRLSPRRTARLESALDGRAEVAELLAALRRDRAALRALPEPTLERDLLSDLEPALARPMLVGAVNDAAPGAWRRRHRRARIAGRIGGAARRLAVAAAILVLAGGGLAVAWSFAADPVRGLIDDLRGPRDERVAESTTPPAGPADAAPARVAEPRTVPDWDEALALHHAGPLALPPMAAVTTAAAGPAPITGVHRRPRVRLQIDVDATAAETALLASADGDDRAAIVRNLTRSEVDDWLARRPLPGSPTPDAPLRAGGDRDAGAPPVVVPGEGRNADRGAGLDELREASRRATGAAGPPAGVLHGDERFAPPGDVQVRRSAAGDTWTIVVPAERAAALLARLDAATDGRTRLDVDDRPSHSDALRALEGLRRLRAELADAAPGDLVEIAVRASGD